MRNKSCIFHGRYTLVVNGMTDGKRDKYFLEENMEIVADDYVPYFTMRGSYNIGMDSLENTQRR